MKAKTIMIQGTGSGVGKSILTTALCRIFLQDGYRTAPFKAQNMALNSFVTDDGGEIGRAQAVQAQSARINPSVDINPILLKPCSDLGAQVIVKGKPIGNMEVNEYIKYKKTKALEVIKNSFNKLSQDYDIIVIEGAGSPAEINLIEHDIVNIATAEFANAPVILVGDIDKGGVFASFVGTLELLPENAADRIKGFIINKFRGNLDLLRPGIDMLADKTKRAAFGVIPYMHDIKIAEEDGFYSHNMSFPRKRESNKEFKEINIEILYLPHISNFTDFDPFVDEPDVSLKYIRAGQNIGNPDVLIIPGSKNTISDLKYLYEKGYVEKIKYLAARGVAIIGVCGGLQMLGKKINDPEAAESNLNNIEGMGLLDIETIFEKDKMLQQVRAIHRKSNISVSGYEIHMGRSYGADCGYVFDIDCNCGLSNPRKDGAVNEDGNVWGTYIHGVFDNDQFRRYFIDTIRQKKGLSPLKKIQVKFDMDKEYDKLAKLVRNNIDMESIYHILNK